MPTVTSGIHPAHAANMTAKAHRLATFLTRRGGLYADADLLAWLSDKGWAHIADLTGERTIPSPATRAATVVLVRAMTTTPAPIVDGTEFKGLGE